MKFLVRLASTISRGLAFVGASCVVLMMFQITIDVLLRNLFRLFIPVTVGTVTFYYMVGIAFLPLAFVEVRREMVSVELIEFTMPGPLLTASDFLVLAVGAVTYCALAATSWETAVKNWRIGSFVEISNGRFETSISYFILPVGFGVAAFVCIVLAVDRIRSGATKPSGGQSL